MQYGFELMNYTIPTDNMAVEELVAEAGYGTDMAERLKQGGLDRIPLNKDSTLDRLINRCVTEIKDQAPELCGIVKGVMLAHSLPFLAPAHIPFIDLCLKNTGFDHGFKIAVSGQPCAVFHQVVQLAMTWLSREEKSGILLIGADQAHSAQERVFFNSAMGDAAVAGIITNVSAGNRIMASVTEAEIIACEGEMSSLDEIEEFRSKNPSLIRHCIESALEKAGITMKQVRYIIPHTPYRTIWDIIATLLRIPREKIMDDYIVGTGHFNSNDSFCHYIRACREKRLNRGDIALLINPGFGGSHGCTIIEV